jgi:hypothetical protein
MNINTKNLLTDYNSCQLNDISTSDIQQHTKLYKKIDVYNNKLHYPLQKLWIKTPQLKVYKVPMTQNYRSSPISIIISENDKDSQNFCSFIEMIEIHIETQMKEHFNLKIKKSVKRYINMPPIIEMKLPCKYSDIDLDYKYNFKIYNEYNKLIEPDYIRNDSLISIFIELSEVWIGEEDFGFNWNVQQMKIYPEPSFDECLFDDYVFDTDQTENKIQKISIAMQPPPPCPVINQNYKQKTQIDEKNTLPKKNNEVFSLSVDEILSVRSKLKSLSESKEIQQHILNNNSKKLIDNNIQVIESTKLKPTISDILSVHLKPIPKKVGSLPEIVSCSLPEIVSCSLSEIVSCSLSEIVSCPLPTENKIKKKKRKKVLI